MISGILLNLRKHLPKGGFGWNALTLMTGTAIAQAIPIAISPILTRIYSPDEFGLFALFLSISSLIAVLATGRYDLPIMLPEKDEDAASLLALSFILIAVIVPLLLVLILIFNKDISHILKNNEISPWLYLIPISVLFTASYSVVTCWSNRQKKFKRLSINRVVCSSTISGINLILGFARCGISGLIAGNLAGQGTALGILGWRIAKDDKSIFSSIDFTRIRQQARRYLRFPFISLPADFMNVAAQQAPILMLSLLYNPLIVGLFSLTQRVLALPLTFISQSILGVFQERASRDYNALGNCKDIYLKTFKGLLYISLVPFIIFFITSPWLFSFIFGKSWYEAGVYAQILSPLFFFRFISSPLSYVLYVAEKQNYDLLGQTLLVIVTISALKLGSYVNDNPRACMVFFSISCSIVYIFYLMSSYHFSKGKEIVA